MQFYMLYLLAILFIVVLFLSGCSKIYVDILGAYWDLVKGM